MTNENVSWIKKQLVKVARKWLVNMLKKVEGDDPLLQYDIVLRTQAADHCAITPWGDGVKVIVIRVPNKK